MKRINPLLQADYYKINHYAMYPEGTTKIYSNLTPRKSRLEGVDEVVVFGFQYFAIEYLIKQWDDEFFNKPKEEVVGYYKWFMDKTLGKDSVDVTHIEQLHDLGYLPLHIKTLDEGTLCPIGVPMLTITNTVDHAYWLVNYLETILSTITWQPITSATIALQYKKLLIARARESGEDIAFVDWQGHDFSMRGLSSLETAAISGGGHLLSFTGTDNIPAIQFLMDYYAADLEKELIGSSVPATEHSVMCMGMKDGELETFRNLLKKFPNGILSVVSDTWDLWKVCTEILPTLKEEILARDGKLVIRPDSGDPVDILCGQLEAKTHEEMYSNHPKFKGVIELLWDVFGGTINEKGYRVLDSHIGAIYGDSITLDRADQITARLMAKGFASTNVVFGVGSFTYQYNTRDTFGFAVKATYGEVTTELPEEEHYKGMKDVTESREIFKDPITDDGTKRSAKGLLMVYRPEGAHGSARKLAVKDQCTEAEEKVGLLTTLFYNGVIIKRTNLQQIRERLAKYV